MTARAAVVLAAGKGTRMKSDLPKVLHSVGGRAMLSWTQALADELGCDQTVVVVGPEASEVQDAAAELVGAKNVCIQHNQLGTADAVKAAAPALEGFTGDVIVLYADTPLIPASAAEQAFEALTDGAGVSVLGFYAREPGGYGRLIRNSAGDLDRIVEAKDASSDESAVDLCNSGVMAAAWPLMANLLEEVGDDNAKGEYYLTDLVGLARRRDLRAAVVTCEERDVLGVNSRAQLAEAEAAFQVRAREAAMSAGVSMAAPETVYFSWDTKLGRDVYVEPNVVFGPGVTVADKARIKAFSHLEGATVGSSADVGPFARLRPGAQLGDAVKIGNFVEVKNVTLGEGAKVNHLSYVGDGSIGADANIGAGVIFCNYDGFFKHQTLVGAGAFIGSNSALVAPVSVGDGAYIGSGSVITKDVEADALGVARAKQVERKGWARAFKDKMAKRKASEKKD
ncbi:MAG: bifunctional UDP-N-acetylglucosamine diphosphorylase/glucosamine-1-phosphate N-acetyltransferase GlmU [Pseudomonadota bacterium]